LRYLIAALCVDKPDVSGDLHIFPWCFNAMIFNYIGMVNEKFITA